MALFRREPLFRTTVDLEPARRVAVALEPGPGRWPGHEGADRLVVPVGLVAIALARATDAGAGAVHGRIRVAAMALAETVAADPWELVSRVAEMDLVPHAGEPAVRVRAQLVRSALGPVPTIGRASHAAMTLAEAAAAVLGVALAPSPADLRLASALTIEGLLGWYRAADPHLQPPQQAIAFALRHARARLMEQGRPVPEALGLAVREHRKVAPMAGGAPGM